MNKEAFIRSWIKRTAGTVGEEFTRSSLGQIKSDDAAKLIEKTLRKTWLPIAGVGLATGAAVGLGFGAGQRLSQVGVPARPDPATYSQPLPPPTPVISSGAGDVHKLGALDAMEKVALRSAFGGLPSLAPAALSNLKQTTSAATRQRNVVSKATVKPPASAQAKPMVVKTPQPPAPQVGPATITPTQMPAMQKLNALRRKKSRDRTSGGEPRTGGEPMRPGEDMRMKEPQPGNQPLTFTNGRPHDF